MKRSWFVVTLLLIGAAPADAQRITSPYRYVEHAQSVSVYGGYFAGAEGRLLTGPQAGLIVGANWGYRVTGPFTLGLDVGYATAKRTVRDTVFVTPDSVFREIGEADINLLTIMGIGRFDVTGPRTWHGLQPYIVAGAGAAIDIAGASDAEKDLPSNARFDFGTSFAGLAGAGVEWYPSSRLSARLEGRSLLWKLGVPEAFQLTQRGERFGRADWESNFVAKLGLVIHF